MIRSDRFAYREKPVSREYVGGKAFKNYQKEIAKLMRAFLSKSVSANFL